jgi:RHS repeat-associated protein
MKQRITYLSIAIVLIIINIISCCNDARVVTKCANKDKDIVTNRNVLENKDQSDSSNIKQGNVQNSTMRLVKLCKEKIDTVDPIKIKKVSPKDRTEIKTDEISLQIDSGSVKKETEISIIALNAITVPKVPEQMKNMTKSKQGYRLLPNGQTFERDITIGISYDSTQIPLGYVAQDIYTYFYNEQTKQWQQIERDSVDEVKHIIYSKTNHFTDYINGILKTPETSDAMAYTPTSIKDLNVAQPLNGITIMSPPEANNKGTANLSYPITVPAGRRGMQPSLNLTYNSGGGSSWLGLGWNINISEISVETRWGVPLYDSIKETETYLLDGETLVLGYVDSIDNKFKLKNPAYRREWEDRGSLLSSDSTVQFYPRVEGSFRKIIRHGDNPKDYWWEVIDKSGTKYYYGKKQTMNELDNNSVLSDYSGNVAKWCLTRVEDVYGNTIQYDYNLYVNNIYGDNLNSGKQICIYNINYTGHLNERGKYNVKFNIDDSSNTAITTSGRYGFEELNKFLLNKIEVMYDTMCIRTYCFGYKVGEFNKNLLCCFYECDSTLNRNQIVLNSIFNRCYNLRESTMQSAIFHGFEYNQLGGELFTDRKTLDTKTFGIGFEELPGVKVSGLTDIEGSEGSSNSGGVGAYVGFGHNIVTKVVTLGGGYGIEKGKDRGLITLIDINGDGYPDKVYRDGNTIKYRLQEKPAEDNLYSTEFESEEKTINSDIEDFQNTKNTTKPYNFDVNVTAGHDQDSLSSISGNNTWGATKSSTSSYFIDVDGDGLVDLVYGGRVYLNRLDAQGYPEFSDATTSDTIYLGGTCGGYILNDKGVDGDIFGDKKDTVWTWVCSDKGCEWHSEIINYKEPNIYEPNIDAVKVWIAPYTGDIRIKGNAEIPYDVLNLMELTHNNDGLKLSINKYHTNGNSTLTELVDSITLDTVNSVYNLGNTGISINNVKAGDMIFFRMQSNNKRIYDKVIWNQNIKYYNYTGGNAIDNLEEVDADGNKIFEFNASQDFMVGNNTPDTIQISIGDSLLIRPKIEVMDSLSDTLTYKVYRKRGNNVNVLFSRIIPKNNIINLNNLINADVEVAVDSNDQIWSELLCKGMVKWSAVKASVTMAITHSNSNYEVVDTISEPGTKVYTLTYKPSIKKNVYQYLKMPSKVWNTATTMSNVQVSPNVVWKNSVAPSNYTIIMTVKNNTGLIQSYTFTNSITSKIMSFQANDNYYIDYYVDEPTSSKIDNIVTNVGTVSVNSGLYTNFSDNNAKFGILYRGWGQFGYKPNQNTSNPDAIDVSLLNLDAINTVVGGGEIDTNTVISVTDTNNPETEIAGGYNPLNGNFFIAQPDNENNYWVPYGGVNYFCKDTMSNFYSNGIDTDYEEGQPPIPYTEENPRPTVVNKESYSDPHINCNISMSSFHIGGLSLMGSYNRGTQRVSADMMDVNGDGYPDVVSGAMVQYSKSQGGLSDIKRFHIRGGVEIDNSNYNAFGTSAGGIPIKVLKEVHNGYKNSKVSMEGGTAGSITYSNGGSTFIDVNGDGLPDKINSDNKVYLNYGYSFSGEQNWNDNGIKESTSGSLSLSGNLDGAFSQLNNINTHNMNLVDGSISCGLNACGGKNMTNRSFLDVNGDGLIDIIYEHNGAIYVKYNTGTGFSTNSIRLLDADEIDRSYTVNAGIHAGVSIGVSIWFFKIVGNLQGSKNWNLSFSKSKWIDMNNDGYPDYVEQGDRDNLYVRYSLIGQVNLLNKIITPTNTNIDIGYEISSSSEESQRRYYEMRSMKEYNYNGYGNYTEDTIKMEYEYKNRKYDRYEREDYGYEEVKTKIYKGSEIYKEEDEYYNNSNYIFNGIKEKEIILDVNNRKIGETDYEYKAKEIATGDVVEEDNVYCFGDVYPAINKEIVRHYLLSGDTATQIMQIQEFSHGENGNVNKYKSYSIPGENDSIVSNISYYKDTVKHILGIADTIKVKSSIGQMRERYATINVNGDIDKLTIVNTNNIRINIAYQYDVYGNIKSVSYPANANGNIMTIHYKYDNVICSLPIEVNNISYGYISTATYDYKWQQPINTIDIGGNSMEYSYDERGRIKTVRAPKEIIGNKPYTIKYEYSDLEIIQNNINWTKIVSPFWAKTYHYDSDHSNNDIEIVTLGDRLGKVVQIKKDIDSSGIEKRSISGKVIYDNMLRESRIYDPISEDIIISDITYNHNNTSNYCTTTVYDILDRPIRTDYPNGTYTTNAYLFGNDYSGIKRFLTQMTDQNGHTTNMYEDARELKTQVIDAMNNTTKFIYDAIGQIIKTIDPENDTTIYTYDQVGRRLSRKHPSSGLTQWEYDNAGNITKQIMQTGEYMTYKYDYNHLTEVDYSDRPWNNVWYEYGANGDGNQTGRLKRQQDASGVQEFNYDEMGNMNYNKHTYVMPNDENDNAFIFTMETKWDYDSWGRIKNILYPDIEKVTYSYDLGGNLKSVIGSKNGQITKYVDSISYDEYEQRIREVNGNGVVTNYSYDPMTRRLSNLNNLSQRTNTLLQDNRYNYDNVGNIIRIQDNGQHQRTQEYGYDNINRLINSTGNWSNNGITLGYENEIEYSATGKIQRKRMESDRINTEQGIYHIKYANEYQYDNNNNPYAVMNIHDEIIGYNNEYRWDEKGNMISNYNQESNQERKLCWTEDNRLQGYIETNGQNAYYNYNAGGERNMKITGKVQEMYQNGRIYYKPMLYKPTMYASELVTISNKGYTKHYFEGGKRICSKIGVGFRREEIYGDKVEPVSYNYDEQKNMQRKGVMETFNMCMGVEPEIIEEGIKGIEEALNNEIGRQGNELAYYYHSDHLGSASYITDDSGAVTQTLNYLPYGEDWVDLQYFDLMPAENNLGVYKFNGKEKDAESGYNYYGARYYDSEKISWLSVDPMSDKYPSLSPYVYCANNPVKLIDPDGEEIWIEGKDGSKCQYKIGMKSDNYNGYAKETINALNKLSDSKTAGLTVKKLALNKTVSLNIEETNGNTISNIKGNVKKQYTALKQTIEFNPYQGIEDVNTKEILSPALALGHEIGHVETALEHPDAFWSGLSSKDNNAGWSNAEEFFNIIFFENNIADEWGELKRTRHTLTDDSGKELYKIITTYGSISNKRKK